MLPQKPPLERSLLKAVAAAPSLPGINPQQMPVQGGWGQPLPAGFKPWGSPSVPCSLSQLPVPKMGIPQGWGEGLSPPHCPRDIGVVPGAVLPTLSGQGIDGDLQGSEERGQNRSWLAAQIP